MSEKKTRQKAPVLDWRRFVFLRRASVDVKRALILYSGPAPTAVEKLPHTFCRKSEAIASLYG